jgi:hypothetical protein
MQDIMLTMTSMCELCFSLFFGRFIIPFLSLLAQWVWGHIVQVRLDGLVRENGTHRIRKQKSTLLPSGARRIDIYKNPEDYGGRNQLIKIPSEDIDKLLAEYDQDGVTEFGGTPAQRRLFTDLYRGIGGLAFVPKNGWPIFTSMVNLYRARLA